MTARVLGAIAAAALVSACAIAPPRAARLPPITAPGFAPERDERRLWHEAEEMDARAKKSGAVLADAGLERYLLGVARRLTPRAALDRLDVRVRVIEAPGLSAFVSPDGGVFVTMGLLARLENEAQLAIVIGHELVHAVNRHAIVEYRTFKEGAALASGLPFGLGAVGTLAAVTGYSRDLEREADEEGLAFAAAGGWDVGEATRPFEHLAAWVKEEEIEEPFVFATHPRLEERIESYRALLRTRYAGRRGGDLGRERYLAAVREVVLASARLDLAAGRFGPAERGAKAYLALRPGGAQAYALLGDVARQRGGDGAPGAALAAYRRAVELDPRCPEAQRGLGLALARSNDREGARAALRAYLALSPAAVDRAWIEGDLAALEGRAR
ncbi:M48 family metallopeptidase [Anaeromyxobacter terrae]|uniref:M48 family metallopeptidase n=1 Tax=Anaeromyxobacter terrae TaxID=2925406 RepID=UPI001F59B908|nr:M48 family metallopeptidase [Anaeromyxobacter sp. SG22]